MAIAGFVLAFAACSVADVSDSTDGRDSAEPPNTVDDEAVSVSTVPDDTRSAALSSTSTTDAEFDWSVAAFEIVEERPHDDEAFTQGLVLDGDVLYESTGLFGESQLRRVDPVSGAVLEAVDLDPELFGEGLALDGDRLVQLTWKAGRALVYERDSLELIDEYSYDTEGWGLCHDGDAFLMTDGTASLYRRHSETFEVLSVVDVAVDGEPVELLNELECVDDKVMANVWRTDQILVIEPATGEVVSVIDASELSENMPTDGGAVLNGIAYDDDSSHFLLTGKLWPSVFVVEFAAVGDQERPFG